MAQPAFSYVGANKSLDTNLQHKGSLRDLCETFGFSQLLGAGDTLLIRPSAFNVVFGSHFADAVQQATVSTETFWLAAKFLYLGLHNQRVLFLDSKVVNQTSRLPGWFSANDATALKESDMCFQLVKDFGELFKATQPIGVGIRISFASIKRLSGNTLCVASHCISRAKSMARLVRRAKLTLSFLLQIGQRSHRFPT